MAIAFRGVFTRRFSYYGNRHLVTCWLWLLLLLLLLRLGPAW